MEEGRSPGDDSPSTSVGRKARPARKRCRVMGEKLCQVCGDRASAHHFGALACDTCKAFFRRNALKQENKKCLFEGNCPVDLRTRRFCPACRLQKCLAVGMQSDLILDEEERKERMQKVNKKRRQQVKTEKKTDNDRGCSSVNVVSTSGSDSLSSSPKYHPLDFDGSVADYLSSSRVTEWGAGTMETVTGNPVQSYNHISETMCRNFAVDPSLTEGLSFDNFAPLADTTQHTSVLTNLEKVQLPTEQKSSEPIAVLLKSIEQALLPFEQVPRNLLPSDPFMYWRLSEEERSSLANLSAAYQDTVLCILKCNPPKHYVKPEALTYDFYFREFEFGVRNCITFAKHIEDFCTLQTTEQMAVLKASIVQVLSIRGCAVFIDGKEAWPTPDGYFTMEHARTLWPEYPYLDVVTRYSRVIKDIVKNDCTIYALLHCIALFDPSDEKIVDRQLVNSIRDKYIILLRHYLESVYSYLYSEHYFMALLEKFHFIRDFCVEGRPLMKKVLLNIPNQLIAEILDLN